MLKTQKVFWWRTGCANTEGKLGKEPDGEMGSYRTCLRLIFHQIIWLIPIQCSKINRFY